MGAWTLGEDGKLRDKSRRIACEHGRVRNTCKECGGACVCEHGRQRYRCLVCRPATAANAYKHSAGSRGFSWELSETRASWLGSQSCTYCGEPIALGIDRGRNDYGYTVLNALPCCSVCNFMKMKMSARDFVLQSNKIATHNSTYDRFKARWIETRTTGPDLEFKGSTDAH